VVATNIYQCCLAMNHYLTELDPTVGFGDT